MELQYVGTSSHHIGLAQSAAVYVVLCNCVSEGHASVLAEHLVGN
jgi:hypothetical protein